MGKLFFPGLEDMSTLGFPARAIKLNRLSLFIYTAVPFSGLEDMSTTGFPARGIKLKRLSLFIYTAVLKNVAFREDI